MTGLLKFLKWAVLVVLMLMGAFATFYGFAMHDMQMNQISRIGKHLDAGEISEAVHLAKKDMILTQGFIFLSLLISSGCLIMLIIYLYISLLLAKRKLKSIYIQKAEADPASP